MNTIPCPHPELDTKLSVLEHTTTGEKHVTLTAKCSQCGLPFHFPHFQPGTGHGKPGVNLDASEVRLPIKPGKGIKIALEAQDGFESPIPSCETPQLN